MDQIISREELKNNIVVRSGFLFNEKRPLGIFEFDDATNKGIFSNKELWI